MRAQDNSEENLVLEDPHAVAMSESNENECCLIRSPSHSVVLEISPAEELNGISWQHGFQLCKQWFFFTNTEITSWNISYCYFLFLFLPYSNLSSVAPSPSHAQYY